VSNHSHHELASPLTRSARPAALNPRKSPRQSRATSTVAIILEGAARVLEESGLRAYSTNAVANRAGVSVGSVYQYFPAKEAITRALIQRETGALLAEVKSLAAVNSPRPALEAVIDACVAHQLRRPALARILDLEEARLPLGDDVADLGRALATALHQILLRGGLRDEDATLVVAADLLAIIKGIVDAAGQRGETDAAALSRRVRRAVFGFLPAEFY